jgi:hypothetical protein
MYRRSDPAESKEARRGRPARIDPAIKSWLDSVIIPSLVQQFLSERKGETPVATEQVASYSQHNSERKP